MKKSVLSLAAALFCAVTPVHANPTDQAIDKIKASTKTAVSAIQELSAGAENIRTVAEAVTSLDRYYAIVSRMITEINAIDKELGASVDTKKLLASLTDIKKQTQAAGLEYGTVLGKLPQAILSADEFVAALQKLKDILDI